MHMADALIAPAVAGTMAVCSGVAAAHSIRTVRLSDDRKNIPLAGVMGAFVFAAQMINFSIPGTGSSGHLTGGMMLAAVLGPEAAFLSMIGVLTIQCLFFADGGLLALGCNIWNMAFYGCFIGGGLIWRAILKGGISKKRITAASILGCILSMELGALSVTIETTLSGITELPFNVFLGAMLPIHVAIGLVEGLITAAVLCFIYETRPEMLKGIGKNDMSGSSRMKRGTVITVIGVAAAVVGGVVSLFASGLPDGLEWSVERVAGEVEGAGGGAYTIAERIQNFFAFLPDYSFPGSESAAGTSVSGIVGSAMVLILVVAVSWLIRSFMKQKQS